MSDSVKLGDMLDEVIELISENVTRHETGADLA
jgi:hypothetical protein